LCCALDQSRPCCFLHGLRGFGTVVGEVSIFNLGGVVRVDVITMEAPADNLAEVGIRTTALAVGRCCLLLLVKGLDLGLLLGHRLRHAALLFGFVLRARPKLYRAVGVVIAVHRKAANANAVLCTLVVISLHLTPMLMRVFVRIFGNVEFSS
jgi:hypothetical protein